MRRHPFLLHTILAFLILATVNVYASSPYDGKTFHGRIAFSSDGNFNDEDDWGAFPTAIAILDAFDATNKLVHIDYNNILPQNDPRFYREMSTSVLEAAERYHIPRSILFDCQKDLEDAIESIKNAIDSSSADDPLYFVLAGPMEVPFRGIERSDPQKRQYVYCISHSIWNDGYNRTGRELFTHNKRDVIPSGIHWIQIRDGNRLLAHPGGVGKTSTPEQWQRYHWLRDSPEANLRWIFSRLESEKRCDISDSCMMYFLLTGDQNADLDKLNRLLNNKIIPQPLSERASIRIEAENCNQLTGCSVYFGNDRSVSHRLCVQFDENRGTIKTQFNQPYSADAGRYEIEVRYFDETAGQNQYTLLVNGIQQGKPWRAPEDNHWTIHTLSNIQIQRGDEISVDIQSGGSGKSKLDYVQFDLNHSGQ